MVANTRPYQLNIITIQCNNKKKFPMKSLIKKSSFENSHAINIDKMSTYFQLTIPLISSGFQLV